MLSLQSPIPPSELSLRRHPAKKRSHSDSIKSAKMGIFLSQNKAGRVHIYLLKNYSLAHRTAVWSGAYTLRSGVDSVSVRLPLPSGPWLEQTLGSYLNRPMPKQEPLQRASVL